jgi:hypothetical protein
VRLPAEFLVKYHAQNTRIMAGLERGGGQDNGSGAVMLCPCLGEVHKDIVIWGKRGPMPPGPHQAALVDNLQCSAVLLRGFAKCQGVQVVNKAGPRG